MPADDDRRALPYATGRRARKLVTQHRVSRIANAYFRPAGVKVVADAMTQDGQRVAAASLHFCFKLISSPLMLHTRRESARRAAWMMAFIEL